MGGWAKRQIGTGLLGFAALLWIAIPAQAVEFGFNCITNNSTTDCGIAEAQLTVDVTDAGGGQVSFRFENAGPLASSITDVYFDDGSLLGIATITDGPGVDFEQGASPGNLPGGGSASPPFVTTAGFSADSEPPTQPNGVNPGEFLVVTFNLQGSQDFNDVLDELDSGALRIGIHVQGFAGGGSESLVNNGTNVPEPSATMLLGLSLVGVALLGSRKFKVKKLSKLS